MTQRAEKTRDLFEDSPPTPVTQAAGALRPLVSTGVFYNTVNATGAELAECRQRAATQEQVLYAFFLRHPTLACSPSRLGPVLPKAPITSIRRALTNLTAAGILVKTDQQTPGVWGKPEHLWRLSAHQTNGG